MSVAEERKKGHHLNRRKKGGRVSGPSPEAWKKKRRGAAELEGTPLERGGERSNWTEISPPKRGEKGEKKNSYPKRKKRAIVDHKNREEIPWKEKRKEGAPNKKKGGKTIFPRFHTASKEKEGGGEEGAGHENRA